MPGSVDVSEPLSPYGLHHGLPCCLPPMAADPRSSSTHMPLPSATLEVTAVPVLPPAKVKKALNAKKKWTPEHERELVLLECAVLAALHGVRQRRGRRRRCRH